MKATYPGQTRGASTQAKQISANQLLRVVLGGHNGITDRQRPTTVGDVKSPEVSTAVLVLGGVDDK